jgi:hypothetical protein
MLILALVCASLLVARGARGEHRTLDPRAQAEAKRLFDEGTTAYNLGEFTKAAEAYRATYKITRDPVLLYNIAQSYRLANDLGQAAFFYRSYLRNVPTAPNRVEVEERLRRLRTQIGDEKSGANGSSKTAMSSGGKAQGETPAPSEPLVSPPASAPEPATAQAPAAAINPLPPPPRLAVKREPLYKKWWLWTIVGGAAAAAAVGVGVGVGASAHSDPSTHFGTSKIF